MPQCDHSNRRLSYAPACLILACIRGAMRIRQDDIDSEMLSDSKAETSKSKKAALCLVSAQTLKEIKVCCHSSGRMAHRLGISC